MNNLELDCLQIKRLIHNDPFLFQLTAIRLALRDIENGDFNNAVDRLRSEADKLVTNKELYNLVMGRDSHRSTS